MEWLEVSAPSVEAAKEIALDNLGVHKSDAEFEIITEEKTWPFGFGRGRVREEARVRARIRPVPVPRKRIRGRRPKSSRSRSAGSADNQLVEGSKPSSKQVARRGAVFADSQKPRRSEKTDLSFDTQVDLVESFVAGIAEKVDIELEFTRHNLGDGVIRIGATGDDIGILIGKRGTTSKAINDLAKTVLQRSKSNRELAKKIRIDIGDVEFRRHAALSEFVRSIADEVLEYGQEISLEPMDRVDRKIIHDVVAEIDGVDSHSEGNDRLRHVVIVIHSSSN